MAVYRWYCAHERCGGSWKDYDKCEASSRYWYRDKNRAQRGADNHERRTEHKTFIQSIDGRKVRGKIK